MKQLHRAAFGAALVFSVSSAFAQGAPASVKLRPAAAKLSHEFSSVLSVRELVDGRVLVADATENRILVADFVTNSTSPVGRTGQGPGEYQMVGVLHRIGRDSTLMVESKIGRWHLFDGPRLALTLPPDHPAVVAVARLVAGADARGFVVRTVGLSGKNQAMTTPPESAAIIRVNRASARIDTLGSVKLAKAIISTTTGPGGKLTSVSVTRPVYTVGEEIALFEDGWLAVVRLDPYRVDWIASDGKVTRGQALSWTPVKVSAADVASQFQAQSSADRGASDTQAAEALRARIDAAVKIAPAFIPPVAFAGLLSPSALTPLADGRLLVRHPTTAAQPNARYDMIDRRGALVGTIALTRGETIATVSSRWAYVVTTDDDGLQFLSRHPWP